MSPDPIPTHRPAPPTRPSMLTLADDSGYTLARMRYEIILSPEAVEDLHRLRAYDRTIVRDAIETHLRHEAMKLSKSRIKRLRSLARPQYRLRAAGFRVFYDVSGREVRVLAVVPTAEVENWLGDVGEPE